MNPFNIDTHKIVQCPNCGEHRLYIHLHISEKRTCFSSKELYIELRCAKCDNHRLKDAFQLTLLKNLNFVQCQQKSCSLKNQPIHIEPYFEITNQTDNIFSSYHMSIAYVCEGCQTSPSELYMYEPHTSYTLVTIEKKVQ